ncbi:aspartyl/asparaginyl beta-hydroxylase domain-containing protein [Pontixanthobacter gangjinensis]|uniref:Aspartyl/asparaginyl beta-hydroxylase domain-containing protein n=1 Tax=Pontixanthobacter gangjinensis TaxID=1028742 RepID=A0A6I4SIR3_9SPHN|nr:aspartyl/asparaginyl beta-hydroxylase domain-containing protein [Pontixanthobacter gangjinensis]MXO55434.1 aspartyl/asparaginyl beta-hydroxylase domain-containing protein [Pontixanthobacter gangjinensis]
MNQPARQSKVAHNPPDAERYIRPKQKRLIRLGKRLRDPVNRLLAGQSKVGDAPIIDPALVPGLNEVAHQWAAMRAEIAPLMREREAIPPLGRISPDHRRIASTPAWKSFFFQGYGYHVEQNEARCPTIVEAISRIPGVVVAFLSIMEPGTHVPRHRGLTKSWLNCHLPLMLPDDDGRCEIAINDKIVQWRKGEWLVFDETYPHEVWNQSGEPRVVLLLQVQRQMRLAGHLASRALYHAIRHSSFVGDVRKSVGK